MIPQCQIYQLAVQNKIFLSIFLDPSVKVIDDPEVLGTLHTLYSMTFNLLGKKAVAAVLSMEDNLQVLLPFAELTGNNQLFMKVIFPTQTG